MCERYGWRKHRSVERVANQHRKKLVLQPGGLENSKEKIYFFADASHVLKLVRNWLLDTGFMLENGKVVNTEPLKILVKKQNCCDLTMQLISCHLQL